MQALAGRFAFWLLHVKLKSGLVVCSIFLVQLLNLNTVSRYTENGLLCMLDRNRRIKPRPERFQNCQEHFDMIITCEERVYDQVIEGIIHYLKFVIITFSILQKIRNITIVSLKLKCYFIVSTRDQF